MNFNKFKMNLEIDARIEQKKLNANQPNQEKMIFFIVYLLWYARRIPSNSRSTGLFDWSEVSMPYDVWYERRFYSKNHI